MEFIRKKTKASSAYERDFIIKCTQDKRFVVSSKIIEKLNINVETQALMFGWKNNQLHLIVEEKADDNFHLSKQEGFTHRFRSSELYEYLVVKLKLEKGAFTLKLKENNILELV